MTRETKLLIDMWDILHRECHKVVTEENYDAIKKSIKALEQEPCDDCISRQAVIELCEGWWLGHTKEDDFATEVRALPSVNPQEPCEMTAEEYRQRMIQAFHNADCDELIAICVLPTEKEFEHLEWLLKSHYKKEPCEDAVPMSVIEEIKTEIRHFMFEVNPSSSESDYACNYIMDLIDKKMGKESE